MFASQAVILLEFLLGENHGPHAIHGAVRQVDDVLLHLGTKVAQRHGILQGRVVLEQLNAQRAVFLRRLVEEMVDILVNVIIRHTGQREAGCTHYKEGCRDGRCDRKPEGYNESPGSAIAVRGGCSGWSRYRLFSCGRARRSCAIRGSRHASSHAPLLHLGPHVLHVAPLAWSANRGYHCNARAALPGPRGVHRCRMRRQHAEWVTECSILQVHVTRLVRPRLVRRRRCQAVAQG
mmetsp:Transcript_26918/g.68416  ORF Transcript_26918/g.68416 Transcript_26918/m.68416 type:complete len:235 (+) Transcript_26918:775-1479(+)